MAGEPVAAEGLLKLGTSSWSSKDWVGKVYAAGTKPVDYIAEYAKAFPTVEIDSTFYGTPRRTTVEGWRDRTPEAFVFSAKAPKTITHEKFLEDCQRDTDSFLDTMAILGPRLGPILFQFPYYAKRTGVTLDTFCARLDPFLVTLPETGYRFAVEVRNKSWIAPPLLGLLRRHGVTLALIDHPWMDRPGQLMRRGDLVTGSFVYMRWLGDRKGIESVTTTWRESVIDRRADLEQWAPVLRTFLDRSLPLFGYFNNHYSGHAPADLDLLREILHFR
jgi:uncharacterized protein YecE (DUF72 family)